MKFLVPVDLTGNEIRNARAQVLAADPATPAPGRFWYNSTDETLNFAINDNTVIALSGSSSNADTLDGHDTPYFLDRANHTGTQSQATITGLTAALAALAPLASPALTGNPTAPTAAPGDNDTTIANTAFVAAAVAAAINSLVDAAPGTLDTLNELAAALGDDPNFATTITAAIAAKTGKYATTIGDGAATAIVVTHNLGTRDVVVSVHDAATYDEVVVDVQKTTVNTVTLTFATAPAMNSYRVAVVG